MWLPFGARDQDRGAPACGASPGNRRAWGGVGGWGRRLLKVSGADGQWFCVPGSGRGRVGGTVAPRQECAGLSGNASTSLPTRPLPNGGLPHWVCPPCYTRFRAQNDQRVQKAKGGAGSLGIPGATSWALEEWWGGGAVGRGSFPVPLTCWVTLGKPLPPSRPHFPICADGL